MQGLGVHGGQPGLRQRGWHGLVQRAATLWRLAWPAPWTALGLLLALPAWALGARGQWRDGVLEVSGGRLGRAAEHGWAGGFAAVTLGHVVLAVSAAQLDRLRWHERCHVRQYERWGLLFVPAYLAAGAWAWAKGQTPQNTKKKSCLPAYHQVPYQAATVPVAHMFSFSTPTIPANIDSHDQIQQTSGRT